MNRLTLLLILLITAGAPRALSAADRAVSDSAAVPAAPDAAWLAKAVAAYPLKTCVVSGEEFGGKMGDAINYVYKLEGKPDRLVRFCCKDCRKDFDQDPALYLKKIDEAAAKAKHG
jgi:hypothetical protein